MDDELSRTDLAQLDGEIAKKQVVSDARGGGDRAGYGAEAQGVGVGPQNPLPERLLG